MSNKNDSFMSRKSFVEVLVHDAFNPGIRQQSFDMINYVILAIVVCSIVAVCMKVASFYLLGLILIASGFVVVVNMYKNSFLEATAIYDKMQEAERVKSQANEDEYDDEDYEDYEYEDEEIVDHQQLDSEE